MLVAGIDLAAEPKGTALALIEWNSNKAKLQGLFQGADDAEIVKLTKCLVSDTGKKTLEKASNSKWIKRFHSVRTT